jgi:hypothetical protein
VQSVQIPKGELIAFEWTFAPILNYMLAGSKAVFIDMKGPTCEWIYAQIFKSTGVDQVSHLLIESKQKMEENDPAVHTQIRALTMHPSTGRSMGPTW